MMGEGMMRDKNEESDFFAQLKMRPAEVIKKSAFEPWISASQEEEDQTEPRSQPVS